VPLLAFVVLIDPFTDYLGSVAEGHHPRLWPYLVDQTGTRDTGPLWFVALLLLLSLAYAAGRRLHPAQAGRVRNVDPRYLVAVATAIAVGSFVVRLGSPVGAESFANLRWEAWPQGSACSPWVCWRGAGLAGGPGSAAGAPLRVDGDGGCAGPCGTVRLRARH
jgi:hypothetical protein